MEIDNFVETRRSRRIKQNSDSGISSFDEKSECSNSEIEQFHEKNLKCDKCDAIFPTEKKLLWHQRGKPYLENMRNPCSLCPFVSCNKYKLKEHNEKCHFSTENDCFLCEMTFVKSKSLKAHLLKAVFKV